MAERTEERTRDRERESAVDPEIEALLDDRPSRSSSGSTDHSPSDSTPTGTGGLRARLRGRSGDLFALRPFGAMLVLSLVGGLLGGVIPLVGGLAGLLGVFLSAFGVGLVSSDRHYVEAGLAGAVAAGVTLVLGSLNLAFIAALRDFGPEFGVIGAGAGLLVALIGHYFGRDLRDGLTMDI
jgi:hypothetical protein